MKKLRAEVTRNPQPTFCILSPASGAHGGVFAFRSYATNLSPCHNPPIGGFFIKGNFASNKPSEKNSPIGGILRETPFRHQHSHQKKFFYWRQISKNILGPPIAKLPKEKLLMAFCKKTTLPLFALLYEKSLLVAIRRNHKFATNGLTLKKFSSIAFCKKTSLPPTADQPMG